MTKEATRLVQEFADESTMIDTNVPMSNSDEMNTILQSKDGEAVFKKQLIYLKIWREKTLFFCKNDVAAFDGIFSSADKFLSCVSILKLTK